MPRVLLGLAMFALSLGPATGQLGVASGLPLPVLLAIAGVAAVAAWHAPRAWWPLAVVGAAAYAGLGIWPPIMLASYYAGASLRRGRDVAAYLGAAALAVALSVAIGRAVGGEREMVTATPVNALFMALLTIVVPLLAGLWIRARAEVRAAARERAERLEQEQVMRAERARAHERARIAREMHDVVAHRVSLMVLHAGALEMRAPDDGTARAAALIGGIGREALTNLRDVLGVLRHDTSRDPQPMLADLDRLLDQSRELGIEVTRRDEGERRPLRDAVERTAYRIVQEALTNVHKHSGGAPTAVTLRFEGADLEIEVHNARPAPTAPATTPAPSGWGLVGLRERVELIGGTLAAGAAPDGGFRVRARIPA
ncbi:sensor histidine kinase [Nonomuraea sp. NPDC050540]|uniref:sensor histidine kinase n=1 Tax=Nonomuraea sp. NPDC050540 TaxID=3364367 RepID=UPI0037ACC217